MPIDREISAWPGVTTTVILIYYRMLAKYYSSTRKISGHFYCGEERSQTHILATAFECETQYEQAKKYERISEHTACRSEIHSRQTEAGTCCCPSSVRPFVWLSACRSVCSNTASEAGRKLIINGCHYSFLTCDMQTHIQIHHICQCVYVCVRMMWPLSTGMPRIMDQY